MARSTSETGSGTSSSFMRIAVELPCPVVVRAIMPYGRRAWRRTRTLLERERGLQPRRLRRELDPLHPLDPPEAAAIGGDRANRTAVPVRERRTSSMGGQEQPIEVIECEAPAVAGYRDDVDARRLRWDGAEDAIDPQATPYLLGVPPAGAIKHRAHLVLAGGEVGIRHGDSTQPCGALGVVTTGCDPKASVRAAIPVADVVSYRTAPGPWWSRPGLGGCQGDSLGGRSGDGGRRRSGEPRRATLSSGRSSACNGPGRRTCASLETTCRRSPGTQWDVWAIARVSRKGL